MSSGSADAEARERRRLALLARAPWLGPMLARLPADAGPDPSLSGAMERCLLQFEELPDYALGAIGTLLQDEPGIAVTPPARPLAPEGPSSPEGLLHRRQVLQADPAFALALHCVDARLRPRLAPAAAHAALAGVSEQDWFGLLHASARPGPLLTPAVAVLLVLRAWSAGFWLLPSAARSAALRLFGARAADLRAQATVARLCAALPGSWALSPEGAGHFVAAAAEARAGLAEACGLASRIATVVRTRCGGLAALEPDGAVPATGAELSALQQSARRLKHLPGFDRLLRAL